MLTKLRAPRAARILLGRVRAGRGGRWAWRVLLFLLFVAVFGDFLANEKPLVASYQDSIRFPIFRDYGVGAGLLSPYTDVGGKPWQRLETDWAVYPPIPYSARTLGKSNLSPIGPQRVASRRYRHWLGTDGNGRDLAAGLISGTRIALAVGVAAMSAALLVGLLLGGIGGFFGNRGYYRSRGWLIGLLLGGLVGALYAGINLATFIAPAAAGMPLLLGGLGWVVGATAGAALGKRLDRSGRLIPLPLDATLMRLVELFNSVPGLLLLLAIFGFMRQPTLLVVMLIIGLLRWTGIARFVRAELLRIRSADYILAGRVAGYSESRLLWRHALPNALGPVIVALSFGMAGAVLLEAFLSFLGVGLPPEVVTWGRLLAQSRARASSWWLAVFPGMAIFVTVMVFNTLGEVLTEKE